MDLSSASLYRSQAFVRSDSVLFRPEFALIDYLYVVDEEAPAHTEEEDIWMALDGVWMAA